MKIEVLRKDIEKNTNTLVSTPVKITAAIRLSKVRNALQQLFSAHDWEEGWLLEQGGIYMTRNNTLKRDNQLITSPPKCGSEVIIFLSMISDETQSIHNNTPHTIAPKPHLHSSSINNHNNTIKTLNSRVQTRSKSENNIISIPKNYTEILTSQFTNMYNNNEINFSVQKGDSIMLIGSPFGITSPTIFYNSWSKGIISNLLYHENIDKRIDDMTINFEVNLSRYYLGLIDARHLPGMEGGAVYNSQKQLVGIVIPPFRLILTHYYHYHLHSTLNIKDIY